MIASLWDPETSTANHTCPTLCITFFFCIYILARQRFIFVSDTRSRRRKKKTTFPPWADIPLSLYAFKVGSLFSCTIKRTIKVQNIIFHDPHRKHYFVLFSQTLKNVWLLREITTCRRYRGVHNCEWHFMTFKQNLTAV